MILRLELVWLQLGAVTGIIQLSPIHDLGKLSNLTVTKVIKILPFLKVVFVISSFDINPATTWLISMGVWKLVFVDIYLRPAISEWPCPVTSLVICVCYLLLWPKPKTHRGSKACWFRVQSLIWIWYVDYKMYILLYVTSCCLHLTPWLLISPNKYDLVFFKWYNSQYFSSTLILSYFLA